MNGINKAIRKHTENSEKLREIYMADDSISYKKSLELQKQQQEEYKKVKFFLNLKKEMLKNNKKGE